MPFVGVRLSTNATLPSERTNPGWPSSCTTTASPTRRAFQYERIIDCPRVTTGCSRRARSDGSQRGGIRSRRTTSGARARREAGRRPRGRTGGIDRTGEAVAGSAACLSCRMPVRPSAHSRCPPQSIVESLAHAARATSSQAGSMTAGGASGSLARWIHERPSIMPTRRSGGPVSSGVDLDRRCDMVLL